MSLSSGIRLFVVLLAVSLSGPVAVAADFDHGGGCRKSSPPGRCCHMDRKAGVEHCH
ncbi:hypothetical protein [Novispirillum itersonii]|uniref:hypothetical protein n=1 Tax=Novispirillum itersonii TaxID=189 RepID=UPI000368D494|nr:hypothetical protein [Novispirillum itersonii]